MKRRHHKNLLAHSIVEVLIASFISLGVLLGIFSLFLMYGKTAKGVMTQAALDADGRRVIRQLQGDLRRSSDFELIELPFEPTDDVASTGGTAWEGTDLMRQARPSGNHLSIYFPDGSTSTYSFENGTLRYDSDGSGPNNARNLIRGLAVNMDNGSAFSVTSLPGRPAQLQVHLELVDSQSINGLQSFTMTTAITSRLPRPLEEDESEGSIPGDGNADLW